MLYGMYATTANGLFRSPHTTRRRFPQFPSFLPSQLSTTSPAAGLDSK